VSSSCPRLQFAKRFEKLLLSSARETNIDSSPLSNTSCLLDYLIYFIIRQCFCGKCLKVVMILYLRTRERLAICIRSRRHNSQLQNTVVDNILFQFSVTFRQEKATLTTIVCSLHITLVKSARHVHTESSPLFTDFLHVI